MLTEIPLVIQILRLSLKQGMGNPGIGEFGNSGIRESGNRGIRESRTDKTGILVCLLENAFATLFRIIQTMNIQYIMRISCLTI